MTPDRKLGVFYAAFAAGTWGTVFVLSKWLVSLKGLPVVTLAFWRFAICTAFLMGLLAVRGKLGALRVVQKQPLRFLVLGVLGGYAMYLLVLLALKNTTANNAQIIMNANPVFIAPLALLIGERLRWRNVLGLGLGLLGCVLVIVGTASGDPENPRHVLGGALALAAGICWAAYTVVGRDPARKYGGLECTAIAMGIGTVLLGISVLATGADLRVTARQALLLAYLGLVPTGLGFVAWFKAMETLPASVAGPFQFLQPVIGVALAVCFLHEKLTGLILLGAVLAFAGVCFTTAQRAAAPGSATLRPKA